MFSSHGPLPSPILGLGFIDPIVKWAGISGTKRRTATKRSTKKAFRLFISELHLGTDTDECFNNGISKQFYPTRAQSVSCMGATGRAIGKTIIAGIA